MTMSSTHTKVLNALTRAMEQHLDAVEKSKFETFLKGGRDAGAQDAEPIVFVRSKKVPIRFSRHFSPDADLMLHDRLGGTFALIRILDGVSHKAGPATKDLPSHQSISKIAEISSSLESVGLNLLRYRMKGARPNFAKQDLQ
jgi:hypothetical protein